MSSRCLLRALYVGLSLTCLFGVPGSAQTFKVSGDGKRIDPPAGWESCNILAVAAGTKTFGPPPGAMGPPTGQSNATGPPTSGSGNPTGPPTSGSGNPTGPPTSGGPSNIATGNTTGGPPGAGAGGPPGAGAGGPPKIELAQEQVRCIPKEFGAFGPSLWECECIQQNRLVCCGSPIGTDYEAIYWALSYIAVVAYALALLYSVVFIAKKIPRSLRRAKKTKGFKKKCLLFLPQITMVFRALALFFSIAVKFDPYGNTNHPSRFMGWFDQFMLSKGINLSISFGYNFALLSLSRVVPMDSKHQLAIDLSNVLLLIYNLANMGITIALAIDPDLFFETTEFIVPSKQIFPWFGVFLYYMCSFYVFWKLHKMTGISEASREGKIHRIIKLNLKLLSVALLCILTSGLIFTYQKQLESYEQWIIVMTVGWLLTAFDSVILIRVFEFSETSVLSQILCGKADGDLVSSSARTGTSKTTLRKGQSKTSNSQVSANSRVAVETSIVEPSAFGDISSQIGHESDNVSCDVGSEKGLHIEME